MAIILIGLLEKNDASSLVVHSLGTMLIAGRTLHAWALSFSTSKFIVPRWRYGVVQTAIGAYV